MGIVKPGTTLNCNPTTDEINSPPDSSSCTNTGSCCSSQSSCSTSACPEDHCLETTVEKFDAGIRVANQWVIPECDELATLIIPNLQIAQVGSYLWNPQYGSFEIVSFDQTSGQVVIRNNCNDGNESPGTEIPSCTTFVVTDIPCIGNLDATVFLAEDFTAPNNGVCTQITVTNTTGLFVGAVVTLSTGQYRISSVDSVNLITICNDGMGVPGGTVVVAKDGDGNFQYALIILNTNIPFTDFASSGVAVIVLTASQTTQLLLSLSITNPSALVPLIVYYDIAGIFISDVTGANTNAFSVSLDIKESINGGGFTTLALLSNHFFANSNAARKFSKEISYNKILSVAAGATTTIDIEVNLTNNGAGGTLTLSALDAFSAYINAVGFIA